MLFFFLFTLHSQPVCSPLIPPVVLWPEGPTRSAKISVSAQTMKVRNVEQLVFFWGGKSLRCLFRIDTTVNCSSGGGCLGFNLNAKIVRLFGTMHVLHVSPERIEEVQNMEKAERQSVQSFTRFPAANDNVSVLPNVTVEKRVCALCGLKAQAAADSWAGIQLRDL